MGASLPLAAIPGVQAGEAHRLERVGLQLYTVRDLMQTNVPATLEQVARVGYKEVEFAGYFGTPPVRLRRWLDDLGLTAPAAHVSLLDGDLNRMLDEAAELGHGYLIQASLPLVQQRSLDAFRRAAASLNRAGEEARSRGVAVGYNNHDFEFRPSGGIIPYDVLLAETDPELVWMEVDVYWMAKADRDPVRYFAAHPPAVPPVPSQGHRPAREHHGCGPGPDRFLGHPPSAGPGRAASLLRRAR